MTAPTTASCVLLDCATQSRSNFPTVWTSQRYGPASGQSTLPSKTPGYVFSYDIMLRFPSQYKGTVPVAVSGYIYLSDNAVSFLL